MFGATAVPDLIKLYAPGTMAPGDAVAPPPDWWWSVSALIGDYVLTCPARRAARKLDKLGHNVFVYYFSHQPTVSVNSYPTDEYGAFHGSEVQQRPKLCFGPSLKCCPCRRGFISDSDRSLQFSDALPILFFTSRYLGCFSTSLS